MTALNRWFVSLTGAQLARTSDAHRLPRLAANPANAILNYPFALLEAEATLACHAAASTPALASSTQTRKHGTRFRST